MGVLELRENIKLSDKEVIGDLFQNMDEGKDFVSGYNNYVWFYIIALNYRPRKIVEMGTRFGYSMKAFVDGANHQPNEYDIHVYDIECDGIKTLHVFENYFRSILNIEKIAVNKVDTQSIDSLSVKYADLVMVDAYHTEEGVFHECSLGWEALRPGGVMVVDDINDDATLNACAKKGTLRFCESKGLNPVYLPSFRGIYLIEKSLF